MTTPTGPLADIDDVVEAFWRPLTDDEERVATYLIGRASSIVRDAVPDIDERIVDHRISAETVASVVVDMVLRVLKNPEALRQYTVSTDDSSESKTLDTSIASGELYLSRRQRNMLLGQNYSKSRVGTMRGPAPAPWWSR